MAGTACSVFDATVLAFAKPVCVARQRRKIREPRGIDVAPGVEQTGQRQLIEYDEHDRRRPFDRLHTGRRFRRQKILSDARVEDEQHRNDKSGGRKGREELANDAASSGEGYRNRTETSGQAVPRRRETARSAGRSASGWPPTGPPM